MGSRSKESFIFSVERLKEETGDLFLWTLTFREVPESDDWALDQWNKGCKAGYREFQGIHGLRVIELHKTHGMHFHLLLNRRFPIERMLRIFWPLGFGRIHVERANLDAGKYLAKYLSKKFRNKCFIGKRRHWAAFGGFRPCRCKDIEFISPFHDNKWLMHQMKFESHADRGKFAKLLMGYSIFGRFPEWPNQCK